MEVKPIIDKKYVRTEIHVCNHTLTKKVETLVEDIYDMVNAGEIGTNEKGEKVMLVFKDMVRFYAESQKVMAQDEKGIYSIRLKLYELEEKLDKRLFMRISKSEIINLKKISRLDMNLTGTIKIIMKDGSESYTSRRNVSRLKEQLGVNQK
ncbi:MAG: LytTR family DNA-binding domain-containing protein [Lachnospiraceae bacterium]